LGNLPVQRTCVEVNALRKRASAKCLRWKPARKIRQGNRNLRTQRALLTKTSVQVE